MCTYISTLMWQLISACVPVRMRPWLWIKPCTTHLASTSSLLVAKSDGFLLETYPQKHGWWFQPLLENISQPTIPHIGGNRNCLKRPTSWQAWPSNHLHNATVGSTHARRKQAQWHCWGVLPRLFFGPGPLLVTTGDLNSVPSSVFSAVFWDIFSNVGLSSCCYSYS